MKSVLEKRILYINPSKIIPPESEKADFDRYRLLLLSESIRENGIVVPVMVKRVREGYKAVSGERRIKAAVLAGVSKIPCVVISRGDGELVRAIESLTDAESNPFSDAEKLLSLMSRYPIERLAAALSRSTLEIEKYLALLTLSDDIKERCIRLGLPASVLFSLCEKTKDEQNEFLLTFEGQKQPTTEIIQTEIKPLLKQKVPPISDLRFYINSIRQLIDRMKENGITVSLTQNETCKYTDIKIRIQRNTLDRQLSLLSEESA